MKKLSLVLTLALPLLAQNPIQRDLSCADAGASDTYACSFTVAPTAYATGVTYKFKANTANTGAATVNFNSLGAKTIKKQAGGVTTDLDDNDIRANQWVELIYDGTNMQMVSALGNAAGSSTPPVGGVFPFFSYFYTGGSLNFTGGGANSGMWWPFVAPVAVIDEIQFKVNTAVASGKAVIIGVFAVSAGAPSGSELCYWRTTTTVETTGYKTSGAPTGGSAVSGGHCNLTLGGTYVLAFSSDDTGVQFESAGLGVGNTISRTKYSHLPGGGASVSTGSGGSLAFTSPAGWGSGFEPLADGSIMAINGSN